MILIKRRSKPRLLMRRFQAPHRFFRAGVQTGAGSWMKKAKRLIPFPGVRVKYFSKPMPRIDIFVR
jgi:hypothetical protein